MTLQQLPPSLSRWRTLLLQFPLELAMVLGDLVARLDLLVGALPTRRPSDDGEPHGFNGLDRRGPYERLLLSEWLLAEEAPHEFLRRAANHEHSFLKVARHQPVRKHRSLALLDAGPSQIGRPRLAHLAMLVVLTQRAQRVGGELHWKTLQHRRRPFREDLGPKSIERFLHSRSASDVTDEDVVECRMDLRTRASSQDVWLIGGGYLERLPARRGLSLLTIAEEYTEGENFLRVRLLTADNPPLEVLLPAPPDRHAVQILRNPFAAVEKQTREALDKVAAKRLGPLLAPASNLVFSADARFLYSRASATGSVIQYGVPPSPPEARVLHRDLGLRNSPADVKNTVWAVGRASSNTYWLTVLGDYYLVCDKPSVLPLMFKRESGLVTCAGCPLGTCFIDAALRRAIVWVPPYLLLLNDGVARQIAPVVTDACWFETHNRVCFVGFWNGSHCLAAVDFDGRVQILRKLPPFEQGFIATGRPHSQLGPQAVIRWPIQTDDNGRSSWTIFWNSGEKIVTVDRGCRLVGCVEASDPLVVHRHGLLGLAAAGKLEVLLEEPYRIQEVTVHARAGLIAYTTEIGGLKVYSISEKAGVLEWQAR